ncbi:MAG TPA: diguanylate cyclase, partial [Rhodocyclaceae bacterium]|nr:diguanylate cyclase [Rhodocyclaceae bacterium]
LGASETEAGAAAQHIADKISAALEREYDLGKIRYRCPVSLGISLFKGEQSDINLLLEDADAAMYRNKQERKAQLKSARLSGQ